MRPQSPISPVAEVADSLAVTGPPGGASEDLAKLLSHDNPSRATGAVAGLLAEAGIAPDDLDALPGTSHGVAALLARAPGDPRLAVIQHEDLWRLLPAIGEAAKGKVAVAVAVSPPSDTVRALAARQFGAGHALALWLQALQTAEHASRGLPRAIVTRAELATDPAGTAARVARLCNLPPAGGDRRSKNRSAARPAARPAALPVARSPGRGAADACPALARMADDLYAALSRLARDPSEIGAMDAIDALRAQWTRALAHLRDDAPVTGQSGGDRLPSAALALVSELAQVETEFLDRRTAEVRDALATARGDDVAVLAGRALDLAARGRRQGQRHAAALARREAALAAARAELDAARRTTGEVCERMDEAHTELHHLALAAGRDMSGPARVVGRTLMGQLLRGMSRLPVLTRRTRSRFAKSAAKRDPRQWPAALADLSDRLGRLSERDDVRAAADELDLERAHLTITAIVPNYNHAAYLPQRLDSILSQSYPLIDIIVLDDCSTDESRAVIDGYAARYPDRITTIYNDANSGSIFSQWRKGVEAARGDLVWICESDDFCDRDFARHLVGHFRDPTVMLAFGDIQFADGQGEWCEGLDAYRERAEPGLWARPCVRPAHEWFTRGFAVVNLIANVGGSIWRRAPIRGAVWAEAARFRTMGDWYLYSEIAGTGQIAFDPRARASFRIHSANSSVRAQQRPEYYAEYMRLMGDLKSRWPVPDEALDRFVAVCRTVFDRHVAPGTDGGFGGLLDAGALRAIPCDRPHVLIVILGFSFGGGELFPINLANALKAMGSNVSVLQLMSADDRDEVRAVLDPAIPVWHADEVARRGIGAFLAETGVSVIHSHIASAEMFFFENWGRTTDLPYVATLHGSYEAMEIEPARVRVLARHVTHWVYTTERNLAAITRAGVPPGLIGKMANGMPVDPRSFPESRADMGISDEALVFAFVARGIRRKGWRVAVGAFERLQAAHPDREMHLLMVGEGELTDLMAERAAANPSIRLLGYRTEIHGLYRLADVALAPTRFAGESYPLCLIQAMQSGAAIIASDTGEIAAMLSQSGDTAGLLVPVVRDTAAFEDGVLAAMERVLDPGLLRRLRAGAARIGAGYAIELVAARYLDLYRRVGADSRVSTAA